MLGHLSRGFIPDIKRKLTPNFKHCFLNYIALFLIFIGSFSWSSLALSEDYSDQWYSDGYYWKGNGFYGHSPSEVCAKYNAAVSTVHCTYDQTTSSNVVIRTYWTSSTQYYNGLFSATRFTCGSSTEDYCQVVNSCPEYGELKKISKLVNGTRDPDTGDFIPRDPNGVHTVTVGGGASYDGCGYAVPIGENIPANMPEIKKPFRCKQNDAGQMECYKDQYMISTGEPASPAPNAADTSAQTDPNDPETDPTNGASTNTIESTSDSFKGASEVVDYEGVASTRVTNVDTEVKDKGAKVLESDSTAVITMSDGIQKTVTTTTTTVEYPDGSKKEIIDSTTGYTATPKTQFVIDKSTGSVSVTTTEGSSASANTKTTNNYDSDGNLTGSNTSQSSEGEGDAEEEQESDTCKENPDSDECSSMPKDLDYGEVISWWEPVYPDGMSGILADAKDRVSENGLVSGFTSSNGMPSTGQLPSFYISGWSLGPFSWGGGTISFADIVVSFLRAIIMVYALLEARRLIFGG